MKNLWRLALPALGGVVAASVALTSIRTIPLPELVSRAALIFTGRIVRVTKTEVKPGGYEIICYLRIDTSLKGEPVVETLTLLDQSIRTVRIQFWEGTVESNNQQKFELGAAGIWFLTPLVEMQNNATESEDHTDCAATEDSPCSLYQVLIRHPMGILASVTQELHNQTD